MNATFKKFCKEIGFDFPKYLEDSLIKEVFHEDKNHEEETKSYLTIKIDFFSLPSCEDLTQLHEKSQKTFDPMIVKFEYKIQNKNYSLERIYDLLKFSMSYFHDMDISNLFNIEHMQFDLNQNKLITNFYSHNKIITFKRNEKILHDIIEKFGLEDLSFTYVDLTQQILDEEENEFHKKQIEEFKQLKERKQKQEQSSEPAKNNFSPSKYIKKYFKVSHTEFYSTEEQLLVVEGQIFLVDKITTKTDLEIWSISITDFEEAIILKLFLRTDEDKKKMSWIKEGIFVNVSGEKKIDYSGSPFLSVRKIEELKQDEIQLDSAEEKRIELSARTSFSAMDGFISPVAMLKHAKKMGHKAIGIVDYQNIQSFPDIYNNVKSIGIKPIYGSTFSTIDSDHKIIWNNKSANVEDETYVIFDLETTSLSPRYGEIIEFGAVICSKDRIIENIQFFIKPQNTISKFTTELTGITQEMLDNQAKFTSEKEAMIHILEIFSNHTLVAHNASFDMGFINEKIYQYGLDEITNQVIDTLSLAKFLIPQSKGYRLEIVAKKFDVSYLTNEAHRADYDAQVLQKIWQKFVEDLKQRNILTFEQMKTIDAPHMNEKKFAYDLCIYAKNQQGLKELFKLVSQSLTNNYANGPKLLFDKLEKTNNLLMAPASINSRLIDLMFTGTTKQIEEEIARWDFIGVPSIHLFSHFISRDKVEKQELEEMLKDLIYKAKKQNKIVVAIGDVRYLDNKDILAHQVYINTKGLEGRRHPLFKYNELDPKYPIQKMLSTQEMKKSFAFLHSSELTHEIVVTNTNVINEMIDENIEVIKSKLYAPNFDNSDQKLSELVYKTAHEKYGMQLPKIISDRIERELSPITEHGFSVVYWLSHKLVAKSNEDGYLVGSRGSVGSSLVATLSGITEVNPLSPHYSCSPCKVVDFVDNALTTSGFDLPDKLCSQCNKMMQKDGQTIPFETFLGFNADKVPDIDLNFSGDYQPTIHQEVKLMFGETHSFRAGTISTVAAKTAFGFVKKWMEESHVNKSNHFVNYLSTKVMGSKRTTGQHPGGIIIIPKEYDVEDFTPINYPANDTSSNWKTTHFDFHAIHDNVLKLDLLGHDDPTAIKQLQKLTNVKMNDISFSDKKVLSLFSSTESLEIKPEDINGEPTGALGIPEFGTRFVRRMLAVAKPKSFNDLINLSGLSHGTDVWSGNAEELIKQGKELHEVISCRDDIMVYLMAKNVDPSNSFIIMEQVRKGKGISAEQERLLIEHGIEQWYIESLKKIKYMFPKAHATAYVMMAWRIAWFKIYYPMEYYATYFTVRSDIFDIDIALSSKEKVQEKLKEFEQRSKTRDEKQKLSAKEESLIPTIEIINEMLARKIKIGNIDLYKSEAKEWKIDYETRTLIPPFITIDGLGEAAALDLIQERKVKNFVSIADLTRRTKLNKTTIEKLTKLNVLKDLEETDQIKLF